MKTQDIAPDKKGKLCDCYNPLVYDCSKCMNLTNCKAYLGWYSRIPHFIIDDHLMVLSRSAIKIFLFLNRRANFEIMSDHYGKCWLTYEQIEKATNVKASNMRKYIKELSDHNLIEWSWANHKSKDGEFKTSHEFTITHYKILNNLGI